MNHLGLSILEIRSLIEKALQPDHCICECHDGKTLSIDLTCHGDPTLTLHLSGIALSDLNSFRAVADLIAKARYELISTRSPHTTDHATSRSGAADLRQHTRSGSPSRYAGR